MALEGPLKELHLQDVFQLLELGRKSGVLRVSSELRQTTVTVCFERGGVVTAAMGNDPQPLVGTRLLRAGKIDEDALARARALQTGGDRRRVGDILVALGAISRRDLDRQLKTQIEETIFDLLSWREGYFRFEEGASCQAAVESPVRLPTEALLMEAARRIDEWSRIEAKIPHLGVVPKLPPPEQPTNGRLDLVPFEWEILAAVDGRRNLRDLADTLGRSEFEVARTMYRLTCAGVLVLDDPARAAPARDLDVLLSPARKALARGDYRSAASSLEEVLVLEPLLPEARRLLGVCLAGQGRFRQAVEAWETWKRLELTPGDEALAPAVDRLREAAEMLARELERNHD